MACGPELLCAINAPKVPIERDALALQNLSAEFRQINIGRRGSDRTIDLPAYESNVGNVVRFGSVSLWELCARKNVMPVNVSLQADAQTQARAQIRAILCCALPFLSTTETSKARLPKAAVMMAKRGVWRRFVRQR